MKLCCKEHYKWIILLIGVFAQITFSIGYSGISVSGVYLKTGGDFSMEQIGLILGSLSLGVAISEVVWGILTDKIGDRKVLIWGFFLAGIVYLIISAQFIQNFYCGRNYKYLVILLIILGATIGCVNSSSGSAIISWFSQKEQGIAMSIRQTAIPVGTAIGTMVFPFLVSGYGFRMTFIAMAALCFCTAVVVSIGLEEIGIKVVGRGEADKRKSPFRQIDIWKIAFTGGFLAIAQISVLTFDSLFMLNKFQISVEVSTILIFIIQIGGGILRIYMGYLGGKYNSNRKMIYLVAIALAISGLSLGCCENKYMAFLLLVIFGCLGISWHGLLYLDITVAAGPRYAGTALGMMGTTVFFMSFIVPYIIPYLVKIISWSSIWFISGFFAFLSIFSLNIGIKS